MIFFSPPELTSTPVVAVALREASGATECLRGSIEGCGASEPEMTFDIDVPDSVQSRPEVIEVAEEFDWSSKKVHREFVILEQKVLAEKAHAEEARRYQAMKESRNKIIFADRTVQDYSEMQRLKLLAEKLAEVQRYLRPIRT